MSDAASVDEKVTALESQLARFAVDLLETNGQLKKVESERDEYRKLVLHLKEEVERLRRGLVGQKAERLPQNDARQIGREGVRVDGVLPSTRKRIATMARQRSEIDAVLKQVRSLPANDQIALVRELMTPRLRLRLLVDQIRSQGHVRDERQIDRAVRRAVRSVRAENRPSRARATRAVR